MKKLHSWNLSYSQAAALQKRLAPKVQFSVLPGRPKLIAGLDCAFSKDGQKIIACAVVLKPSAKIVTRPPEGLGFELVEIKSAVRKVTFPYIPGLLSFREAPVCLAAVEKLKSRPDVFIIDGQGIAHPRRLGLAAHLGLFFDKPTIGCAKSRLNGTFKDPASEKGSFSPLKDHRRGSQDAQRCQAGLCFGGQQMPAGRRCRNYPRLCCQIPPARAESPCPLRGQQITAKDLAQIAAVHHSNIRIIFCAD